jgi:pyrroloquinoline quinone biosynthesis protein E
VTTPRPFALLAEVTHRCPLHCPYCSNPVELAARENELSTEVWQRVLREAAAIGVLQVGFSGGEPLVRADLEQLVTTASDARMYTNLITSAIGLTESRARRLKDAGLDSIQISFQSDEATLADRIAGATTHASKVSAAQMIRDAGFPLTMNVVIHRENIERLSHIVALAEALHAERLELASTQYYGWAYLNRSALLPTRAQIDCATAIVTEAKQRLLGKIEILFVVPDYFADRPKACMHGWGNRHLTVNPVGNALPCPTAQHIPNLAFDNVKDRSVGWIWSHSESFNKFRGTDWLPQPCQGCEFREVDFGGCRCQAALIAGDATATDPACALSPHREKLERFVELTAGAQEKIPLTYRTNPVPPAGRES